VVVNGNTGFLCNVHDPFDLADKMEKILNLSAEERTRLGRNGRALVIKKFNIRNVIDEYIATLNTDYAE
jgi:glycosyltransferase involved in cell wall biosynthesis